MKPVSEIIQEFLESQDVNELSRSKYKSVVNLFTRWVIVKGLNFFCLKKSDVIRYKSDLIAEKKSVYTIDLRLTVVRKLFEFMYQSGIYNDNIALGVKAPRKNKEFRKEYLPVEKVKELLATIDVSTITGKRDYAIISLMIRTGIRRVEVCRMKVGDMNSESIVLQRKGKVNKDCRIGVRAKALQAVHDYLVCRNDLTSDSPMFVAHHPRYENKALGDVMISRMVKMYFGKIGLDGSHYTCHSLRHTAAILALKNGASIYDVQQMLGHTSIETTRIYLRAIDAEKRLDNAAIRSLDELF